MAFILKEMTVGDILSRAMTLLMARLPVFFAIQLIVMSPIIILELVYPDVVFNQFGASALLLLPMIFLTPIASAAMLRVIVQEYLDRPVGVGDSLRFALGRFLPLLGTVLLAGILTLLGCVCIVPGIYLWVVFGMISPVVVAENLAGPNALARSRELVAGDFWRVLGVLLLVIVSFAIVAVIVNQAVTMLFPYMEIVPVFNPVFRMQLPQARLANYTNYVIVTVVSTLLNTLGQTYVAICTTLLYFDLRYRKESFDLGMEAQNLGWTGSWRDDADPNVSLPGSGSPPQTGIKTPGTLPPPPPTDTGIKGEGPLSP